MVAVGKKHGGRDVVAGVFCFLEAVALSESRVESRERVKDFRVRRQANDVCFGGPLLG